LMVWPPCARVRGRVCAPPHTSVVLSLLITQVNCKYSFYTNDLTDCDGGAAKKAKEAAEKKKQEEEKQKNQNKQPGDVGGNQHFGLGQQCNAFAPCAYGLTCKLKEGYSWCVVPVFGKCECMW